MPAVLVERKSSGVWISLNRPERKNALTSAMFEEVAEIFEGLLTDKAKYIVITAQGPDFCAGGDVGAFDDILKLSPEQRTSRATHSFESNSKRLFEAMDRVPQPIVTAARGYAIGAGAQFLLASDLVIASDTLKFSIPQCRLAHTPDHGESYFLPRKAGIVHAMEILLLGKSINAETAVRTNIVNWVVSDSELEDRVVSLADQLAASATNAIRETKALIKHSLDRSFSKQIDAEGEAFSRCAATPAFAEAILSLKEKRAPKFDE